MNEPATGIKTTLRQAQYRLKNEI